MDVVNPLGIADFLAESQLEVPSCPQLTHQSAGKAR